MEIVPTGAALGAEVRGVDIRRPLSADVAARMRQAWLDHLVLIVREQPMTVDQQMVFTRNFGELEVSGANQFRRAVTGDTMGNLDGTTPPEIAVVSNIKVDGEPIGSLGDGEALWHTDSSYVEVPTGTSLLHAVEIPPQGGDTWFNNMVLALETLPADLRRAAESKTIKHAAVVSPNGQLKKGYEHLTDLSEAPGAIHPAVRTHPDTGRQALYLGRRRGSHVIGLDPADSDALLDALWSHATDDRFVYRHRWRTGDIVMWDNRCCMHRRDAFDPASRRLMHRTQTAGERPYQ